MEPPTKHPVSRIAIVHDYFTQLGGAEKVAEEIYRVYPDSQLFATVALPRFLPPLLQDIKIITSWMQKLPMLDKLYRFYFMFYPLAVSRLDLSSYDVVISSSSGYAKGIRTRDDAVHICYCHSPMRWVWNYDSYSSRESFSKVQRYVLSLLIRVLRVWDVGASRRPDHFISNSKVVARQIKRAYGRTAEVIHPPIAIERFQPSREQGNFYIVLARMAPYKRIDIAIRACTELGVELIVIGDGTDRDRLKQLAGPSVTFLGRISESDVAYYAARCKALIFPGEEDFGMAPLEVAAAGRPTIAYRGGGAIETIVEEVTGVFFDEQTPESLIAAILRSESIEWDSTVICRHAEGFSTEIFQERLTSFLCRIGALNLPAVSPVTSPIGELAGAAQ